MTWSRSSESPYQRGMPVMSSIVIPACLVAFGEAGFVGADHVGGWRPEHLTVGVADVQRPVGTDLECPAAFVDEEVMMPTEVDEVGQFRGAEMRPVDAVMAVEIARFVASGPPTGLVAGAQCTPDRTRDRAGLAADVEDLTGGAAHHQHRGRVARQAPQRSRARARDRCAAHTRRRYRRPTRRRRC